jgi:hypothetical protein
MLRVVMNRVLAWSFFPSDSLARDQARALRRILKGASRTDISHKYGLSWVGSIEEYQEKCPVHHYHDLKPYWQEVKRRAGRQVRRLLERIGW